MYVKNSIISNVSEFIKITDENIIGEMLSVKTKYKNDLGDSREAMWKKEGTHYSIFCGKISAICSVADEIINDIWL